MPETTPAAPPCAPQNAEQPHAGVTGPDAACGPRTWHHSRKGRITGHLLRADDTWAWIRLVGDHRLSYASESNRGRIDRDGAIISVRKSLLTDLTDRWDVVDRAHYALRWGNFDALHADLVAEVTRLRAALGEAWDDGNATGLDGWVGPGRGGHLPVDDQAVLNRDRCIARLVKEPVATDA